MILSLPEIELVVMSVSSSMAESAMAWASAPRVAFAVVEPSWAISTASRRMRAMMLVGSRNQNT
jgi:hypothetical protein